MPGLPFDGPEIPNLVARAARGDDAAFAGLVDLYYARCLRYAVHLLGQRADAEEAVQDTFIRVHRSLPAYEHRQRFGAWLYRILLNCCRSRLAASRHVRETSVDLVPQVPASVGPWDGEWERRLEEGLARLPTPQREAFLLHYVEGLGYDEMALVTGEGVSTLKMRVKRAKDRLTAFLRESDYA